MSGQIARALEDAAKKAEQGLAKDFADGYHGILKETEQKTGQVPDHVAENEAKTVKDLGKAAERGRGESGVGDVHQPEGGGGGASGCAETLPLRTDGSSEPGVPPDGPPWPARTTFRATRGAKCYGRPTSGIPYPA